ncbi:MAG: maleylpyruvate isomerase N-terminal domain-containing protein [Nocardioides sp.]
MNPMANLYDACLAEVDTLAADLTPDQLASRVPATPGWTVHQVLAHLAGSASDAVSGRMDGAPGEDWTARHVAERERTAPLALAAELRSTQAAIAASTEDNPRPAIVWNISVHLADLHEALGLPVVDAALWEPVLAAVAPYRLGEAPATVVAGDDRWGAGGMAVEVSRYELYRALFSRRSRAQMQAWGSPGLDADQLDELPVFGPRDDDQPQPA